MLDSCRTVHCRIMPRRCIYTIKHTLSLCLLNYIHNYKLHLNCDFGTSYIRVVVIINCYQGYIPAQIYIASLQKYGHTQLTTDVTAGPMHQLSAATSVSVLAADITTHVNKMTHSAFDHLTKYFVIFLYFCLCIFEKKIIHHL